MRLGHVDVARGLCILLVAWGHNPVLSPPGSEINILLGTIRMPLMFFIAGSFFDARLSWRKVLVHKADALLKPFFVVAMLQAPLRWLFYGADPATYLLGTLTANSHYVLWLFNLWFLPHLWLIFVFAKGLEQWLHVTERPFRVQAMVLLGLLSAGCLALPLFWMKQVNVGGAWFLLQGLPLSMDLLPLTSAFFLAGAVFKRQVHTAGLNGPIVVAACVVFALANTISDPGVSFFERQYPHPFPTTAAALSGIVLLISIAKMVAVWKPMRMLLSRCGAESLFILIFHAPVQSLFEKGLARVYGPSTTLDGVMAYAVCIAVSLLMAQVIRQHRWLAQGLLPLSTLRPRAATAARPATAASPIGTVKGQDTLATQARGA